MKQFTLLSLIAASVLFTACGEEVKEAAKNAANSAVEATKEAAKDTAAAAKDAVVETASKAVDATKEAANTAVEKTVDTAKAAAASTAATVTDTAAAAKDAVTSDNTKGKEIYASKCASCHGPDGKTVAMGKSAKVAGQSVDALVEAMNGYKAGTRNVNGMGMIMKGQAVSLSDEEIKAVSEYMSSL